MSSIWLATELTAENLPDGSVCKRTPVTAPSEARNRLMHEKEIRLFRKGDKKLFEALQLVSPVMVEPPEKEPEASIGDIIVVGPLPESDPNWQNKFALFVVKPARFIHATTSGKRIACVD